ncbi:MAG: DUF3530 family protein [Idiomarina sp.]|nr:DUF3530 family protein [Idiomarina sp.]
MNRILLFSLLLSMALATQPLSAQTRDLDYYLPPGEVTWLEDPEQDARYLMLEQPNRRSYQRGAIVHIPEWGYHPYQRSAIRLLYHAMPDYGWQSFALQPPTFDLSQVQWQQSADVRYPDPIDDEQLANLRAPLSQRLSLARARMAEEPGFQIIVAEGIVAAFLVEMFARELLPAPDALIVIGMYLPQWQLNQQVAETLGSLPFPVLDIAPSDGNPWTKQTELRRRQQASRQQHTGYRQRELPRGRHGEQPDILRHMVYGWLTYQDF